MWTMNDVEEGMFVTSSDGQRMGKVIRCDSETFVVEKGALFPKDYELRYEYIRDVKDGNIEYLLHEDLARTPGAVHAASAPEKVATLPTGGVAAAAARDADTEQELRIPLLKEEMDVEKFQRESGHVKIHKAVHTEEKHFSIPLRREELVIEHVAGVNRESALSAEGAFEDQTLDITLQEEDVRVGKHAVLREEVVVRKVSRSIERDAAASLRTEDLEIEDTRLDTPTSPRTSGYAAPPTRH